MSIREQLAAPFPASDIEFRAGATNRDKTKCLALAYLTARAVQDRLDNVLGLGGWYDSYRPGPSGGVLCSLSCKIDGQWITKEDVADNSDIEAVKGGVSDALKRAAVKFGIGRYLYKLDAAWVACEKRGNTVVIKETPRLPSWALPKGDTSKPATAPEVPTSLRDEVTNIIPDAKRVEQPPSNSQPPVDARPPADAPVKPVWWDYLQGACKKSEVSQADLALFFKAPKATGVLIQEFINQLQMDGEAETPNDAIDLLIARTAMVAAKAA